MRFPFSADGLSESLQSALSHRPHLRSTRVYLRFPSRCHRPSVPTLKQRRLLGHLSAGFLGGLFAAGLPEFRRRRGFGEGRFSVGVEFVVFEVAEDLLGAGDDF